MELNTTTEIIEDIRRGKMVILMDDEDRENEGDLIIAAEMVRPEDINFMARYACGLICLTLTGERCKKLRLPLMVQDNNAQYSTNFTVSIEAAEGVTTGISAADRATTVLAAVNKDAHPEDIVQPGHIFPLKAKEGGVLSRAGHTEAGCDLARLAGLEAASVIVEIMNSDGSMARRPDLEKFAEEHDLKIGTIADLIHYRILHEKTVSRVEDQLLPTRFGDFNMITYQDDIQGGVHMALIKGDIDPEHETLVRVSQMDVFRDLMSAEPAGRKSWSLGDSLSKIESEGAGVVVILANDNPSAEMLTHVRMLQNDEATNRNVVRTSGNGYNTVGTGSQILRDLGVRKMRLLSSPVKYTGISGFDLEVVEFIDPV
jgi:3,4-dihydroxy 2-butanone 4-phosphate synthase / GTP cyclohydrolase II